MIRSLLLQRGRQHCRALGLASMILALSTGTGHSQTVDSFNPGTDPDIYGVGLQSDGKVLLWGHFTTISGQPRPHLGRVHADGTLDEDFISGANNDILTASIQPDGKILVGGVFTSLSGDSVAYLGRLNPDGSRDTSFNPAPNNYVYSVAVQADGRILAGGQFTSIAGQGRSHLVRLNPDGSLDAGFNPEPGGYVYASLIEQGDGKILIGGEFITVGGQNRTNIARLNADGSVDPGFVAEVSSPNFRMSVQADGRILLSGAFTSVNGQARRFLARLHGNGALDESFNPGADMWAHGCVPQADGRILAGGEFFQIGGETRTNVARLNADGTVDLGFLSAVGGATWPDVRSLAVQTDGRVVVGGWFGSLGGQVRNCIGRLINTEPATETLSFDGNTVTWLRGGTAPELLRAVFYASTNGTDWLTVGEGQRIVGGWQLVTSAIPAQSSLRARGYVSGGDGWSSGWFRESFGGVPGIVRQPVSRTNDAGTVARFEVVGGGAPPVLYQWQRDGQAVTNTAEIAGAQAASLVISNVLGANAGGYTVVISNSLGSITSAVATLTVRDPLISSQPIDRTNNAGTVATLNATALGTLPFAFQWRRNGQALTNDTHISGALTASLTISNVLGADAGDYSLLVTNTFGAVTSRTAVLQVLDPVINVQPVNRSVRAGNSASLSVTATGTAPAYQWRKDGQTLEGATAAALTITNAQGADIGLYDVVVTTIYGSVTSAVARLSVNLAAPDSLNGAVNGPVIAMALEQDGSMLLGGAFKTAGGAAHWGLARLRADGSVDPLFTPQISMFPPGGTPAVNALAVQPDGRIVAGGSFYELGGQVRNSLGRLFRDGTLDSTFNPAPNGAVMALAVQPDGKILAAGSFTTLAGQTRTRVGRLNSDGSLDTNFNASINTTVNTLALQPDGKVVIGGAFVTVSGQSRNYLARLNTNGTLDTTFTATANNVVNCVAIQPDGKILVGGIFSVLGGQTRNNLGRLNANGTIDSNFVPEPNGRVDSIAMQADGRILIAGQFSAVAGATRYDLARLNPDGTADPSFFPIDSDNINLNGVAVDSEGRTLVAGQTSLLAGGQVRSNFCRLVATGPATQTLSLDGQGVTWLRGGTGPEFSRAEFAICTNGTGWIDLPAATRIFNGWQVTGVTLPASATVRARGWPTGGKQSGSQWPVEAGTGPLALVTQPQDRTNHAGTLAAFTVAATGSTPIGYRWLKNGQPLTDSLYVLGSTQSTLVLSNVLGDDMGGYSVILTNSFGAVTSAVATLTVLDPFLVSQPTNQLVNAGETATFAVVVTATTPQYQWFRNSISLTGATNSVLTFTNVTWDDRGDLQVVISNGFGAVTSSVATLSVNLTIPDGFNPGANSIITAFALQPGGKILVGGGFSQLGGQARIRLGRLLPDGTLDSAFTTEADLGSFLLRSLAVQPDGHVLVSGAFSSLGGVARANLARIDPEGNIDPAFNPGATGYNVNTLLVQPNHQMMAGGEFTTLGGQPCSNLGLLDSNGVLQASFSPAPDNIVCSLARAANGQTVVGGYFTSVSGQPRNRLARLNPDGSLDATFDPNANGAVYCVAIQPDGRILAGGGFTSLSGQTRSYLARLNPNGSLDTTFIPALNSTVNTIALQANGQIVVGGSFSTVNGQPQAGMARLNPDGSLDRTLNPGPNSSVTALTIQVDGNILVGGYFTKIGGKPRVYLSRLANNLPAEDLLGYDGSRITWLRGGSAPECWRTTFETSTDGTNWAGLGPGDRIAGGWELADVVQPTHTYIRARGFVSGGQFNSSTWCVERVLQVSPLTPPRVITDDDAFGFQAGGFGFHWQGILGQTAVIESSLNLTDWVALQTNAVTAGPLFFIDSSNTNVPSRFYRVRLQ